MKYQVILSHQETFDIEVEADNERDAREAAKDEIEGWGWSRENLCVEDCVNLDGED